MIQLRYLSAKDLPFMQEWMRDEQIMAFFDLSPAQKTEASLLTFIQDSHNDNKRHYAIVDETDEYLGTISLKNIHSKNHHAEYAIVLRRKAQGKGIGAQATHAILEIAKNELKLHKVYLTVLLENEYARKMYEKVGFKQQGLYQDHLLQKGVYRDLCYYEILLGDLR